MQQRIVTNRTMACCGPLIVAIISGVAAGQVEVNEVQKLLPSDGDARDRYGYVAVSGDVALIGAIWDDDNGLDSGSAYVYRFDGDSWNQEQKLVASDGAAEDWCGVSLSVSGDVAVVGSQRHDDDSGAAYVYRFDGATWNEEQKLVASDGAADDRYGAVSVSDDVIVVGAWLNSDTGAAYVYRFDGAQWNEEQKLMASDGADDDWYGYDVAVGGNAVVVGAIRDDDNGLDSGAVYVYRFDGAQWNEEQKLIASDGAIEDFYGIEISVSDDVVVIGATEDDDSGTGAGSAYVYRFDGASWTLEQKLLASDGSAGDRFGEVSVSGNTIVVGANGDDDRGLNSGSAYVYRFDGSSWGEAAKLLASTGAAGDQYGGSVGVSGSVLVVGAPQDDDNGTDSGSAYVYAIVDLGAEDLDDSGGVDFGDLLVVLGAWGPCGECPEDLDGSGAVDFGDVLAILGAWGPCPM